MRSGRAHVLLRIVGLTCSVVLLSLRILPASAQDAGIVETLVRGIEYRSVAITSVRGSAVVQWTPSRTYASLREHALNEERLGPLRSPTEGELSAARASTPVGPEASAVDASELTAMWFDYSIQDELWHVTLAALTNNGHPDVPCALAAPPVDPSLPPRLFYHDLVCDGTREYTYDRSSGWGYIRPSSGDDIRGRHYSNLHSCVVAGVYPWELSSLRDGTARAHSAVHHIGDEGRDEYDLLLTYVHGDSVTMSRLTVVPELGFAVVKRDSVVVELPDTQSGPVGPRLVTGWSVRADQFETVLAGIACPMIVRIDTFNYSLGSGRDAWCEARVYGLQQFAVNTQVELPGPYPYPYPRDSWVANLIPGSIEDRVTGGLPQDFRPGEIMPREPAWDAAAVTDLLPRVLAR